MKTIIKYSILYLILATSIITACPHDKDFIIPITTQRELKSLLTNNLGPTAIAFHMDKCNWCNQMDSIFKKVAQGNQFDHVTFYKANGPNLEAPTHVKKTLYRKIPGYPYILIMNKGKVIKEQIGGAPQEVIIQKLNSLSN